MTDVLACLGFYALIPVPVSVVVDVNEGPEAGIRFGCEVGLARGDPGAVYSWFAIDRRERVGGWINFGEAKPPRWRS